MTHAGPPDEAMCPELIRRMDYGLAWLCQNGPPPAGHAWCALEMRPAIPTSTPGKVMSVEASYDGVALDRWGDPEERVILFLFDGPSMIAEMRRNGGHKTAAYLEQMRHGQEWLLFGYEDERGGISVRAMTMGRVKPGEAPQA